MSSGVALRIAAVLTHLPGEARSLEALETADAL
jgi:hypothetical protein